MDAQLGLIALGGFFSGLLGALMGLGGGIVAVPFLALFIGAPMHTAACAGLISTLSVSCVAAGNYLRRGGLVDIHLALRLELFAAAGGLLGGVAAGWLRGSFLQVMFAGMLLYASVHILLSNRKKTLATEFHLCQDGFRKILSLGLCFAAGILSGLLGIGGGIVVVPVLHLMLGLPFKSATSTSNFMMGFTAVPALFGFVMRQQLDLLIAVPLAAGVLIGANLGAHLLARLRTGLLKKVFSLILVLTAAQMAYTGLVAW